MLARSNPLGTARWVLFSDDRDYGPITFACEQRYSQIAPVVVPFSTRRIDQTRVTGEENGLLAW
jgi:hypothetical protein